MLQSFQKYASQGLFNYLHGKNVKPNLVSARTFTQNLPQLPVPTLEQTIDKYLKSVKPFLNDNEFATTTKLAEDFMKDSGAKLQKLLIEKAKSTENWLAEWWLNAAYLEFRQTVMIWSSPGLVFPFESFKNVNDRLEFTAKLIMAAMDYKLKIDG